MRRSMYDCCEKSIDCASVFFLVHASAITILLLFTFCAVCAFRAYQPSNLMEMISMPTVDTLMQAETLCIYVWCGVCIVRE